MQTNSPTAILQRQASPSTDVVRRWLVGFGEIHSRQITPLLVQTWCAVLGKVNAEILEAAIERVSETLRFFPTPADVLAQIETTDTAARALEDEAKWQQLLDYVRRYVCPDLPGGVSRNAPSLAADVEFAARAAGGLRFLESCSTDDLIWAKKRFLESLSLQQKTGQGAHLLSRAESRKLLDRIQRGETFDAPQPKQLPPAAGESSAPSVVAPRCVPKKAKAAPVELSDEEWQRLKDEQKRRLGEYLASQSCSKNPVPPAPVMTPSDETAHG